MADHSAVITAAAAYSCCGEGLSVYWEHLRNGLNGPLNRDISEDSSLIDRLRTVVAKDLGPRLNELMPDQRDRVGVALGSAFGHLRPYFDFFKTGTEEGYHLVNPRSFPGTLPNSFAVELSNVYSLLGSSSTLAAGIAAGLDAIAYAAAAISRGDEDILLAGGLDEVNDCNREALQKLGLISTSGLLRPFSENRDGTVPADGIGIVLVQSREAAAEGGCKVLAEILSWASGARCYWDDADGPRRASAIIRLALEQARITPAEVDAIFPSAGGVISGDEFEVRLLREVFDRSLAGIPVYPIKSVTGECFAASGPLQCLAALFSLSETDKTSCSGSVNQNGIFPVAESIASHSVALVYSAGYDGTFAAIILGRATGD